MTQTIHESPHYDIPVYKVTLVRENNVTQQQRPIVRDAQSAATILAAYLAGEDREHFVVMMLNAKNRIIGINTVSVGNLTASLAHPREVFKPAILANAAAILVAHNHPSGDTSPSQEDIALTRKLYEGGQLLGITLLDHIIVGDQDHWYSFQDDGIGLA